MAVAVGVAVAVAVGVAVGVGGGVPPTLGAPGVRAPPVGKFGLSGAA